MTAPRRLKLVIRRDVSGTRPEPVSAAAGTRPTGKPIPSGILRAERAFEKSFAEEQEEERRRRLFTSTPFSDQLAAAGQFGQEPSEGQQVFSSRLGQGLQRGFQAAEKQLFPGEPLRDIATAGGAVLGGIQRVTEAGVAGVQEQALAETGRQLAVAGLVSPKAKRVAEEVQARPVDWESIQQRYLDNPTAFRVAMETVAFAGLPSTAALRAPLVALRSAKDTPTMVRIVSGAVEKGLLPFDLVEQAVGKVAGAAIGGAVRGVQAGGRAAASGAAKAAPIAREVALGPARLLTGIPEGAGKPGIRRAAEGVGHKVLGRSASGEANLLQTAEGELIERIASGRQKGWWKIVSGETEYVGKTPESVLAIARGKEGPPTVRARGITQETATGQAELPIPSAPRARVRRAAAPKPAEEPIAAEAVTPATLERGAGAPTAPVPAAGQVTPPPAPAAPASAAAAGAPPPVKPPVTTGAPTGGEEFAANIRLSKYPDDIRDTVKQWAESHADEVQAARRGVRSDAQVLDDAKVLVEEMGGDFAKTQRRWKPGEAWNAEEVTAIRGVLRERTEGVLQAAQAARVENSAANHAKLLLAMQEQGRVQEIVHGVTAEAGRALRAFRQQAFDALKANDNEKLEELLRRLGDREKLDEVAAALTKLDINNPVAVNDFIRQWSKPGFWDYVMELYINGLLSGPKTHIVNALSNTINALVSPVERLVAAGVERGLAPLQRRPVERFFAEASADTFGAIEGIREGARAGLDTIKYGINPSQLSKWEFRRTAFRGKLGKIIRAPGTALEAADAVGYAINYRASLNALIMRQARREGLKGQPLLERVAELKLAPTEALIKQSQETAEYRLFRNESQLANVILAVRAKYPALRFVVPFIRTPVNLVKFGLERSPLGFVNPSLWRNLAIKNPEASDQLARAFLGSTLAALVAWQFAEGRITGAAPKGAAERDRFYREGKLPFAIRVGDTWVQYQRLEPFNQPFAQVAAAIGALEAKDKTATEKVQQAIYTMGQNLVSQNFLTSMNDALNAITQSDRYGPTFLARLAGSAVPFSSLLRTGAQGADPTFRRPRTLLEQVQAGLPGLSRNVPPVLTAFGEEAQRQSPAISPIQFSPAQQSAIDAELERFGVEVGFAGDSIGGVKLTREQQRRYQQVSGQRIKEELVNLLDSTRYRKASDERKQELLEKTINAAREKARDQLQPELRGAQEAPPAGTPPRSRLKPVIRATPVPAGAR